MAFRGRQMVIYGSFGSQSKAKSAHKKHPGSFVVKRNVKRQTRYIVLKRKK